MASLTLRQTILPKIILCMVLGLFGILLVIFAENKLLVSEHTPKFVSEWLFKRINQTLKLQEMYPTATCPIGVELLKHEYSTISDCVEEYSDLEHLKINGEEMEFQRVMIHKPYLTHNDSILIEVGGFKGADADKFNASGIRPHYIMLEPVPMFYNHLIRKFKKHPRFIILNFGLGREEKVLTIPLQTDATSLFRQNVHVPRSMGTTNIKIRKTTDFFDEIGLKEKNVDLLHINCEGCEFELLEDLIVTGYIRYFNHIQFQFHMYLPQIDEEECRYCQIMQLLTRTHTPMFQYRHTWQAWKKIDL